MGTGGFKETYMKIGDRVLVYQDPYQPNIAPTLGIVTRVHQTGSVDVTMFFDVDTIRDLSFTAVKVVGPIRVCDELATVPAYRGGYFAVPLDAQPVTVEAGATIAVPPTVNHAARAALIDAPRRNRQRTQPHDKPTSDAKSGGSVR